MRRSKRLDYKTLSDTGEKVTKITTTTDSQNDIENLSLLVDNWKLDEDMSEEENRSLLKDHLAVEESMLVMEIQDLFEGVSDLYPSNEIYEKALSQALSLRANYRHKHGELQKHFGEDYEGKYGKSFTLQYKSNGEYIKAIKQRKKKELQVEEEKAIRFCNESSTLFLINESDRLINDLKEKFRIPEEESDKAIKRRYDELTSQEKIIQKIAFPSNSK